MSRSSLRLENGKSVNSPSESMSEPSCCSKSGRTKSRFCILLISAEIAGTEAARPNPAFWETKWCLDSNLFKTRSDKAYDNNSRLKRVPREPPLANMHTSSFKTLCGSRKRASITVIWSPVDGLSKKSLAASLLRAQDWSSSTAFWWQLYTEKSFSRQTDKH